MNAQDTIIHIVWSKSLNLLKETDRQNVYTYIQLNENTPCWLFILGDTQKSRHMLNKLLDGILTYYSLFRFRFHYSRAFILV